MKPKVENLVVEMSDPTFEAKSWQAAHSVLTNPTPIDLTYTVELYLDVMKVVSSGRGPITVPAGQSIDVRYPIQMPGMESPDIGWEVYIDVFHEATLLVHIKGSENVIVVVTPQVVVGPITWE